MKNFNYKKNQFFVENLSFKKISKKFKTPFYCYSLAQLRINIDNFKKSFNEIKPLICFSIKSNSNIRIVRELKKRGCGADVVSIGELMLALKAGINPLKIVFSGVGKTEEEIKFAIKKKILLINIESESEAILINKLSKKEKKITNVGIRLNPNIKSGTLKKISTGSQEDKFGLVEKNFLDLVKKIKTYKNLSLECLSIHIGSQILKIKPFENSIKIIENLIKKTKYNFKYIDLGGGIGIPYNKNSKELSMLKYSSIIKRFKNRHNCQIIFEPGRSIVGNTGVLATKVNFIKKTKKKDFIILDAGMNDLMRPALYGARHLIVPSTKRRSLHKKSVEFVGPCCESSDIFLNLSKYQKINENDLLLIMDTGAYGMSLSSNYCFRPKPAEILVDKLKIKLIRKKEDIKKLI